MTNLGDAALICWAAAQDRHPLLGKALARLPFPEKVQAVIRLQEMAAPILRARGKMVQAWSESQPRALSG